MVTSSSESWGSWFFSSYSESSSLFLFSFVREIKFTIFWSFASKYFLHKKTLHIGILQHKYWCCWIQPNFVSGVKLSKEICVNHIEHELVLLTAEWIYFYMFSHQIHQLFHMQGCGFHLNDSIMGIYLIEHWFYQNNLDTTPLKNFLCRLKLFLLKKLIVFIVSTEKIAEFVFIRSNNIIIWKDHLQLDVCYHNIFKKYIYLP